MKFESSHSGIVSWDKMPFPKQTEWVYKHFHNKFKTISQKYKTDFKVIGQFIWCDGLVQNGKITPVGASYLANKFGTKGGMVIFDIKKIQNDQLLDFDDQTLTNITTDIVQLGDEEFNFYRSEDITINDIEFKLDGDKLKQLLDNPDYNKPRYDKKKDAAILESIQELRNQITTQLQNIINNTKGNFSDKGDMIQGIVMKLENGNQYGMFSEGYKTMKKGYSKYRDLINDVQNQFLKEVFGYSQMVWIKKKYDPAKQNEYQQKFNNGFKKMVEQYGELLNQLKNDTNIPKGTRTAQYELSKNHYEKLNSINSYQDFKHIFLGM